MRKLLICTALFAAISFDSSGISFIDQVKVIDKKAVKKTHKKLIREGGTCYDQRQHLFVSACDGRANDKPLWNCLEYWGSKRVAEYGVNDFYEKWNSGELKC